MDTFGITDVEVQCFLLLRPWLIENHGTLDFNAIENNGQLVRAEKKAIMAILLSLDSNEYIFDYWSMGSMIRLILQRLLDFGRLLIDSQEHGPMSGQDLFTGETHELQQTATSVVGQNVIIINPSAQKCLVFGVTESGEKKDYLGSLNDWAYHILLNGSSHPATRENLKHFCFENLEYVKVLPKALRLTRSERLTLTSALKTHRPAPPQISRDQVLAFEFEYSIPDDRSFFNLHNEEDDEMPPLMHAVPNFGAHYVEPIGYIIVNNNTNFSTFFYEET